MRRVFGLALFACCSLMAFGQARGSYEYNHEMPVYIDSIQASLSYPLEWGNDPERDFAAWREKARRKVRECMGPAAPAAADYDVRVIGEERRDGYTAKKLSIALSRWYRVPAYILVPDGEGPTRRSTCCTTTAPTSS